MVGPASRGAGVLLLRFVTPVIGDVPVRTLTRAHIEDVSRLLGHSTVRVTQDLYIAPDADLYDRFYQATG